MVVTVAAGVIEETGVGGRLVRLALRASVGRDGSMAGRRGRWMGMWVGGRGEGSCRTLFEISDVAGSQKQTG